MITDYEKRQKRGYNIHQAKEFASNIVLQSKKDLDIQALGIMYKDLVKKIFAWNEELDAELLGDSR